MRLLESDDARWWVAIGATIGFGMLSKYAIPFFIVGLVVGLLITDARRYLKSKWLWCSLAVALLISSQT